jgi:hypothetical protein
MDDVATGRTVRPSRHRIKSEPAAAARAASHLVTTAWSRAFPGLPNARWVALRLLDGDERIVEAVPRGELGELARLGQPALATANANQARRMTVGFAPAP